MASLTNACQLMETVSLAVDVLTPGLSPPDADACHRIRQTMQREMDRLRRIMVVPIAIVPLGNSVAAIRDVEDLPTRIWLALAVAKTELQTAIREYRNLSDGDRDVIDRTIGKVSACIDQLESLEMFKVADKEICNVY
jgi:hypothetical protein